MPQLLQPVAPGSTRGPLRRTRHQPPRGLRVPRALPVLPFRHGRLALPIRASPGPGGAGDAEERAEGRASMTPELWVKQGVAMFAGSAVLGPLLDGQHSSNGVLHYANPSMLSAGPLELETCWWVPVLFGVAGIILGVSVPFLDDLWGEGKEGGLGEAGEPRGGRDPSWAFTMAAISVFVAQYAASGAYAHVVADPAWGQEHFGAALDALAPIFNGDTVAAMGQPHAIDAALVTAAAIHWIAFDGTPQGFLMASATAVGGPAVETLLIQQGLYEYADPQILGWPTWIAWVYFCGGPAVGSLGRTVRATLRDGGGGGSGGGGGAGAGAVSKKGVQRTRSARQAAVVAAPASVPGEACEGGQEGHGAHARGHPILLHNGRAAEASKLIPEARPKPVADERELERLRQELEGLRREQEADEEAAAAELQRLREELDEIRGPSSSARASASPRGHSLPPPPAVTSTAADLIPSEEDRMKVESWLGQRVGAPPPPRDDASAARAELLSELEQIKAEYDQLRAKSPAPAPRPAAAVPAPASVLGAEVAGGDDEVRQELQRIKAEWAQLQLEKELCGLRSELDAIRGR